ncbi:MAG: hypothetical protein LBO76_06970 [Treponema sp.]|jgi:hypothetical protein|nr:hypothetical protein [Treponema sp.]
MKNAAKAPALCRALLLIAILTALLTVLLTASLFPSCASGGGSWNSYPEAPAYWGYRAGEIRVTVDHVQEEGIASQIRVIAETLLAEKEAVQPDTSLLIDIRVEQRSFLHNVEFLNAIYIDCLIRDEAGNVFGREYEYRVGKASILSAREQERLFKIVLKRILASRRGRKPAVSGATDDSGDINDSGDADE